MLTKGSKELCRIVSVCGPDKDIAVLQASWSGDIHSYPMCNEYGLYTVPIYELVLRDLPVSAKDILLDNLSTIMESESGSKLIRPS